MVLKLDAQGRIEWQTSFTDPGDMITARILQTPDGGYALDREPCREVRRPRRASEEDAASGIE